MKKEKVYKVYYRKKGTEKPIDYIWLKAANVKEAKEDARAVVWLSLSNQKGAVQLNNYMKTLEFYIAKRGN